MHVDVITTLADFNRVKQTWMNLYAADPHATIFLSWPWLRGWLAVTANRWMILGAKADPSSDYMAFFPLAAPASGRSPLSLIRPLYPCGMGAADYTGFVCPPEHQAKALPAIARHMTTNMIWDRLHLRDMMDQPLGDFLSCFPARRYAVNPVRQIPCTYIPLPESWDEYLSSRLGPATRKQIRRILRVVEDKMLLAETCDGNIASHIDAFTQMFQRQNSSTPIALVKCIRSIFQHCHQDDCLKLTVLWDGSVPAGAQASFVDYGKRTIAVYAACYDPRYAQYSPGKALDAYTIRWAIQKGFKTYDFLRGEEPYKMALGAVERNSSYVTVTRKCARVLLGDKLTAIVRRIKSA
jgi:CelD/BcsL family acetyltransferase involved in cellulose biosynthesis